MRRAEDVTFATPALDRAAHLRSDIAHLSVHHEARSIVLWRGKPLVSGESTFQLVSVPLDHPILKDATEEPLFLGLDSGVPVFATDISAWKAPDADDLAMSQFFDPSINRHPDAGEDMAFRELRGTMAALSATDANTAATARAIFSWHDSHRFCAKCGTPSDIVEGGWQRTCPNCGANHFPRTDPVVIVLVLHGNSVLLGRSPHWPAGMMSLLAGFVEPGESIEGASRREVFEESGIRLGEVGYLSSQPWPFPTSLMFGTIGHAETTEITLDPNELDHAAWYSRETVADAISGRVPDLRPARPGSIARFLLERWLKDDLD